MEYPKEIYWDKFVPVVDPSRQERFLVERAYDMGKAAAKNLDGYSNLTAAIKAGEPIDWEKLDGLKVQCVNPDMGMIHGTLERHGPQAVTSPFGWWWRPGSDYVYAFTFVGAWYGERGWTLYVEGEIPTHRKTADQLEVGTYFTGKMGAGGGRQLYVGKNVWEDRKAIFYAPNMLESPISPSKWEVIEEYGPFQKPEDK